VRWGNGNVSISPLIFIGIILFTAVFASALTALWFRRRGNPHVPPHWHERTPEPEQTSENSRQTLLGPDFRPVKLTFGASEAASPVMEISALKESALPRNKDRLDPSSANLNAFNPFLQLIPCTLTAADFGRGNYMQVLIRGSLVLASEPQSFLPFVHGSHGEVRELARLENSDRLRQMIGSGTGWQLASVIAARKHLVEITRKLDYVKRGVEEIKEFLTNERRSKIVGTLDYLRQVVKSMGRNESPAALRNQLEQIERDLLEIQNRITRDLGTVAGRNGAITQGRFERRKKRVNSILERADEMYELQKEWVLCILARTVNWQVLSVFPGDKQLKVTRRESLYKSIDEFSGFLQRAHEQMHEKVATVRSVLDSISTAEQDKSLLVQFDLKRRLREDNNQILSDAVMIRQEIRTFSNRLGSAQKPVVLALGLDKGRIVEAYEIGEN
jgi:hypothetical protein